MAQKPTYYDFDGLIEELNAAWDHLEVALNAPEDKQIRIKKMMSLIETMQGEVEDERQEWEAAQEVERLEDEGEPADNDLEKL